MNFISYLNLPAAWLGPMPNSASTITTPLAAWLYYRDVSTRLLALIGAVMTSLAFASMALTQSDVTISLGVYSVFGAVGMLLALNPSFFLVERYFPYNHPRHVLATSLVTWSFPLGE